MLVAVVLVLSISFVYFVHQRFNYWHRLGVPQEKLSLIGKFKKLLSFNFPTYKDYNDMKHHGIVGSYMSYEPFILVTDPLIANDILVRDQSIFYNRRGTGDPIGDPIAYNLFNMHDEVWKRSRTALSPAFMPSKMKNAIPAVEDVYKKMEKYLEKTSTIEAHDFMVRAVTDIFAMWVFSIKLDTLNEETNEFLRVSRSFFSDDTSAIKNLLWFFIPSTLKLFRIKALSKVEIFFKSLVNQALVARRPDADKLNDFLQFLIEWKSKNGEIDDDEVTAGTALFFLAGFDTVAMTLAMAFYEISKNTIVQQKIQQEIGEVMAQSEGTLHDDLRQMKYLECCVDETLRKYPVAPSINRECKDDYKIASKNLTIPKGTMMFISSIRTQRDPDIYEGPMEFRPERFMTSSKGTDTPGTTYFPFGSGHHICIGQNLAKMTVKMIIFKVLHNFNLKLASDDVKEVKFVTRNFLLSPAQKINIQFTKKM